MFQGFSIIFVCTCVSDIVSDTRESRANGRLYRSCVRVRANINVNSKRQNDEWKANGQCDEVDVHAGGGGNGSGG